MSESKSETINLLPDHVSGMRLAVMLAARGVNGDGLAGLVAEAERVGRMADALCALVAAVGDTGDAVRALADAADGVHVAGPDWDPCRRSEALRDGLRAAAEALTATD